MRHAPLLRLTLAGCLAASAAAQLPSPTTGDLLVSNFGSHELLRISGTGQEIGRVSLPANSGPRGIAVERPTGWVFAALQNTNQILVLTPSIEARGSFSTGAVTGPTGLAFGPNGDLYVPGFSSGTIGRYTTGGQLLGVWNRFTAPIRPNCLAFAPDGSCYVADVASSGVVHLDANGQELNRFSGYGLRSPMGTVIRNGELFVCGGSSHNVAVFDLQGNPLREFRHPDMSGPQALAFDQDGNLLVTNFFNHKVNAFRPDGTWMWTTSPPSARTPRGAAFLEGATITPPANPVAGTPTPFAVRSRHDPLTGYVCALSFGSGGPGIPLPGGKTWDLAPDALFLGSLFGQGPVYQDFFGVLDVQGTATPTLNAPALPVLTGVDLHFGVFTVELAGTPRVSLVADTVTFRY